MTRPAFAQLWGTVLVAGLVAGCSGGTDRADTKTASSAAFEATLVYYAMPG